MEQLQIWKEYYQHFNIDENKVRDRTHARIIHHGKLTGNEKQENGIVLIHGLTDSPHFVKDIGEYFYSQMGFNVYIPLLEAHGLKEPKGMKDASLKKWKEQVLFSVREAQKSSQNVSIGGFSTGGALSIHTAINHPDKITGGVFVFSAALDIAEEVGGDFLETILRTPIADIQTKLENYNWFGQNKELVNNDPDGNPYRYTRVNTIAAQKLSHLIREIEQLTGAPGKKQGLIQPLFAVHSEFDTTVDIKGVEELISKSKQAEMFRIGKNFFVPHSSVVLKDIIKSHNHSPLEPRNPFFDEMMKSIHEFAQNYFILQRFS